MYSVVEKQIDLSGSYIVRVTINENRTHFFTFEEDPSQEQIDRAVQSLLEREERLRLEQITGQEIEKEVNNIIEEVFN